MNRPFVHELIQEVTASKLAAALGVSLHAVRYAKSAGVFPASWYATILRFSGSHGLECPLDAFSWKAAPSVDPDRVAPP